MLVTLFGTGITLPAWDAYLGDFTVPSRRATMLGNINSVLTWSGNAMLLLVTIGMDIIDPTRTSTDVFIFVFLFTSINFLLAIIAGFFLPSAQERSNKKIHIDISLPAIKSKIAVFPRPLKKFLLANFLFTIAWGTGWPVFPYVILEVSNSWFEIGLLAFIMGIAWALSQRLGGKLADKIGRKAIITWTRLALLLTPILMILAIKTNDISWIFLTNITTGLFIGGSFIAIQSLVLDLSTSHNKATLLSINNMVSGLGAFIGSTVTGVFLQFISGNEVPSLDIVSYLLFGVFIVRLVAWFSYLFIEEPVRNDT
jgi:MFS family permease